MLTPTSPCHHGLSPMAERNMKNSEQIDSWTTKASLRGASTPAPSWVMHLGAHGPCDISGTCLESCLSADRAAHPHGHGRGKRPVWVEKRVRGACRRGPAGSRKRSTYKVSSRAKESRTNPNPQPQAGNGLVQMQTSLTIMTITYAQGV